MNSAKLLQAGLVVAIALALGACATVVKNPVSFSDAQAGHAQGSRVLWGGQIISTAYVGQRSCFVVAWQPLGASARPSGAALLASRNRHAKAIRSPGFFVACKPGHHDRHVLADDRYVTVTGTVENTVQQSVGGKPHTLPEVAVNQVWFWGPINRPHEPFWYGTGQPVDITHSGNRRGFYPTSMDGRAMGKNF